MQSSYVPDQRASSLPETPKIHLLTFPDEVLDLALAFPNGIHTAADLCLPNSDASAMGAQSIHEDHSLFLSWLAKRL